MTVLFDYWRSSAAFRVRMALNLLAIPYTAVPVNLLAGEHSAPDNLARNPQGLVPTLQIDGLTLTQSLAIIEYLDETRGGLLPRDPAGRARVRALAHAIAMEIAPVCNLSVRNQVERLTEGRTSAEDWQKHHILRGFRPLEAMLAQPDTQDFCHGNAVSMADLCLVPQVYNAERLAIAMADFPRICAITERLRAVPEIAAAHPDRVKPV